MRARTRVVIVDDDAIVASSLATILSVEDDVDVVGQGGSGTEAVRLYEELRPDVVLLDIRMPGGDGLAAAEQILARDEEARIVFLTTFSDDDYIVRALRMGARGYLIKQDVAQVAPALRSVMAGLSVMEGQVLERTTAGGGAGGAGAAGIRGAGSAGLAGARGTGGGDSGGARHSGHGPRGSDGSAGSGRPAGPDSPAGTGGLLHGSVPATVPTTVQGWPSAASRPAAFASLTEREYEVVEAVAEGLDNAEVAERLFMSEGTVRNHVSAVLAKLGLRNRTQVAVLYYRSTG